MPVHIHVCVCVHVSVHVYVCLSVHLCVRIYVCLCVFVCVHMHVCTHVLGSKPSKWEGDHLLPVGSDPGTQAILVVTWPQILSQVPLSHSLYSLVPSFLGDENKQTNK